MSKKDEKVEKQEAAAAVATETSAIALVEPATLPAIQEQSKSMDEMFAEDAGAGLHGLSAGDFAIPFLAILQKGSPQVSKQNAKYIKGAEVGDVMNTVSGKLYKVQSIDGGPGLPFIPCGYDKKVVEWKTRDSGGGFVASHKEGDPVLKQCARNEKQQLVHPQTGNIFVDTAYHYGMVVDESGFPEFAVISMYSTQLKKSRNWNTTMRAIMKKLPSGKIFNPPTYSHMYLLHTVGEAKDAYDWCGWQISSGGEVQDAEIYKMAREFSKQIESGAVRVSAPPQEFDAPIQTAEEVPF